LLQKIGDWQALASNIVRLLRDEALALNLIRNGYERSSMYRWKSVRTAWLNVYQSLQDSTDHDSKRRRSSS